MKNWFQNKFIPQVARLGNQRHLSTIRDAFAIFTPIIIMGSLAVLWRSVIFNASGGKSTLSGLWVAFNDYKVTDGEHYHSFLTLINTWMLYIQTGTINVMSVYIAFGIGYFLASSRGNNAPIIAGLTSLASFFAVTDMMITNSWEAGMYWLGARGLVSSIIVGLLATELYCWLSKGDKLAIKMPAGVPPAVSRAFAKLFPIMITMAAAASLNLLIWMPMFFTNHMSALKEGKMPQYTLAAGTYNGSFISGSGISFEADNIDGTQFIAHISQVANGSAAQNFAANKANEQALINAWLSGAGVETSGVHAGKIEIIQAVGLNGAADVKAWVFAPVHAATTPATGAPVISSAITLKDIVVVNPSQDALGKMLTAVDADKAVASQITKVMIDMPVHGGATFTAAIYCGVVAPFVGLADNTGFAFGLALLYVMLISFFWFFGLHGTNIVNGAFNPIWLILYAENVAGADHVFVQGTFDAYVFIGGWGATLALLISTLIFGKRGSSQHEISKFAVGPGVFQINEPVTFGYPLVLNAMLAIPLFIVMPTLVFTTFAGIQWFSIPVVKTIIPWTTPVGFGGLIASGSAWGFVLAIVNLGIAIAIWTPFVLLSRSSDSPEVETKAMATEEGKKVAAKNESAKKTVEA